LSEKEENKYLYDRLTNAYAIRTRSFGRASFGGSAPIEEQLGPPRVRNRHPKRNGFLIGFVFLIALLIGFALFFGVLHW
jgi:hypothetical protein